ncbi:hypothetical protein [Parabacteroides sp. AF48-14]|uniref:hypothetical protein n=1 Tax=Parabacteroides sp. AF48-14 TaxID=2292052 RepID=UPI0011C3F68E|nr:hypothetical protein [Parabacteroides sp. AF48-14]
MKYVVFEQERTGLKMPVLFPDHVTHSEIKIEGTKVVSAGFCLVGTEEIVTILQERSDSLNIGPAKGDRELIIAVLCNAGVYAFMNYDSIV